MGLAMSFTDRSGRARWARRVACLFFVSTLILASSTPSASAGVITWNVNFADVTDSTGVGFDDATQGAARRQTFLEVLDYLGSVLDETGTVDLDILASQADGSGFLASAGPIFFTGPAGFRNGFVYDHLKNGSDPTDLVADATVTFDFGYTWNSETDTPTGSEYDLYTVALHEMSHTIGYLSLIEPDGTSDISGGDPGVYSVYDSFLELGDGTDLFGAGGDFVGSASDLTSGNVYFNGANAALAYGGPVPVYAPSTFASGSSIAHLANSVTSLMNYSVAPGVSKRLYSSVDLGILKDIGWNISTVPEPSTMFLILCMVGGWLVAPIRQRRLSMAG